MLTRIVVGFAVGLAGLLFITSNTPAQPGKGGGESIQKLEADLQKLRDALKAAEADLAKAKEQNGGRGFGGWGRGFGGMDKKGFDKKGDFFMKKDGFKKEFAKMNPDMIKERYEFYKKLYDELPKEKAKGPPGPFGGGGFGPGGFGGGRPGGFSGPGAGPASIEARLDRLTRELEELRSELKKKK